VSTNVGSLFCLHGVKVFDEATLMAHCSAERYEQAPVVSVLVKVSKPSWLVGILPGARIITIKDLMASNQHSFIHN
jgi:hypothetical protein